jgi:hypothetical protein
MKLDIKIKQNEGSDEFYDIKLYTYKEVIETKIDKENLRYLIGKIDNTIVP